MNNQPSITFFMLVTNYDIIIADYSIKSYKKLQKHIDFELIIYCNFISNENKEFYFKRWRKYKFVEIKDNSRYLDSNDFKSGQIIISPEGISRFRDSNCENYDEIWSRELKTIQTDFVATVDADFEIFSPKFVIDALNIIVNNENVGLVSTDYTNFTINFYDSYTKRTINLKERWNTWFCIYKNKCLKVDVSHFAYESLSKINNNIDFYDSAAYLQEYIKQSMKMECVCLDEKYQNQFIHYGAFSKNKSLNRKNIISYRFLLKASKIGFFSNYYLNKTLINKLFKKSALYFFLKIFNSIQKERKSYEFDVN